jgi:hypothetical protein
MNPRETPATDRAEAVKTFQNRLDDGSHREQARRDFFPLMVAPRLLREEDRTPVAAMRLRAWA